MNQETRTIQSSQSEQTKCYFDIGEKEERIYSFEQRVVLKLICENDDIFTIVEEVPYNISQVMNNSYLIENHPIIGSGSFGTVFICWHIISQYFCAVKVHQRCQVEEILQQVNEYKIQTLLNLKFPNGFLALPDRVYVIQESIDYFTTFAGMEIAFTTLYEYLKDVDIQYDEFLTIYHSVLKQILEMHSLRIAHRDIKLSNIMYSHEKGWVISDFGCAQFYQNQKGKYLIQGTKQYMPPNLRILLKDNFSSIQCEQNLFDNDIYSFLISMLLIYKKGSSILQVQKMLDNDFLLKQLPLEFQIYGKSYNYIKLNVLIGLNRIPLQKQFSLEKEKQYHLILQEKLQNQDYLIELHIKQQKIFKYSGVEIWYTYGLSVYDHYDYDSPIKIKLNNYAKEKLSNYIDILLDEFKLVEDKSLLQINSNTKPWQYDLILVYYYRLGNTQKQYDTCLEMQKYTTESDITYKLFEIECLIELDQLQTAHQILEEINNQQYLLDDVSYVKLELYRTYLEKSWLETVVEIQKYYFKVQLCIQHSFLNTRINNIFTWIILQYNYMLDDWNLDAKITKPIEFYFDKILLQFGIKTINPNHFIKELEQRGSDKYGIRKILYILIQLISFGLKNQEKIQIDSFYESTILYCEQNNFLNNWEVYYLYSIYCQKTQQYQKSLSLIRKSMQLIDKHNNLYVLQASFQQMYCEINLDRCQEYQNTLINILVIVRQIQSQQCRLYLIERLIKMLQLLYYKQQFSYEIFTVIQQYLQFETNTEILSKLYKLEWEIVLTYQHAPSLIDLFNNKMLNICENSNKNDVDMLKCIQNIVVISRQKVKTDKSIPNSKVAINYSAKLMQNLIIFEDLFNFKQTETLSIENEIIKSVVLNKEFKQDQQVKEGVKLISEYYYNNYKVFE